MQFSNLMDFSCAFFPHMLTNHSSYHGFVNAENNTFYLYRLQRVSCLSYSKKGLLRTKVSNTATVLGK